MSTNEPAISHRKVAESSDRSFGLVFATVFALIGFWPWLFGRQPRLWAFAVTALFLAAAFLFPRLLAPLNFLWKKLGLALHHITNPIIMGLVYCVGIVPMGLLLRAMGKDLLRLKWDRAAPSYWIIREPPGPKPGSMSKQF
jgi:hypothetical protein